MVANLFSEYDVPEYVLPVVFVLLFRIILDLLMACLSSLSQPRYFLRRLLNSYYKLVYRASIL